MADGWFDNTYHAARRVVIAVIGGTVVLIGLVMLVTPGPAFLVILGGLGILGLEFAWARRWIKKVDRGAKGFWSWLRGR